MMKDALGLALTGAVAAATLALAACMFEKPVNVPALLTRVRRSVELAIQLSPSPMTRKTAAQ